MLNSFNRTFDYSGYEKRLRHYFSDSAPINADITIGLREVRVSCPNGGDISCEIDDKLSVFENMKKVIDTCIENIYPRMAFYRESYDPFSDEQKKGLLMQGLSLDRIREMEHPRLWISFILVRFNERGSTIDYVQRLTGTRFRAHLYKPLMLVKDKIWKLASAGNGGMEELYLYLMSISKQETLKDQGPGEENAVF
jgi:hypothetical protein